MFVLCSRDEAKVTSAKEGSWFGGQGLWKMEMKKERTHRQTIGARKHVQKAEAKGVPGELPSRSDNVTVVSLSLGRQVMMDIHDRGMDPEQVLSSVGVACALTKQGFRVVYYFHAERCLYNATRYLATPKGKDQQTEDFYS